MDSVKIANLLFPNTKYTVEEIEKKYKDEIQMLSAIRKISDKYCASEGEEHRERAISKEWKALCLLEMEIDHISGKQARELMMQRRGKN